MMISLLEVFISFLFFFVFQYFFLHKKSHGNTLLKNWPFVGMVPGMLVQLPRIYDLTVDLLQGDLNYAFKGVWFSGTDFLLTVDPWNINHILCSNFGNYPKGPEFRKIFDPLGAGIITVDAELWEDLRKSNHTIFHHQDFLELSRRTNISKLEKDLFPFLDNAAEENIIT